MQPISAATLGGSLAPASIVGRMGGASVYGRMGAARMGGAITAATMGGEVAGAAMHGTVALASGVADYVGPYEVTPTRETQVLGTAGRRMASDVVVAPIPKNYGLVTWDGSIISIR